MRTISPMTLRMAWMFLVAFCLLPTAFCAAQDELKERRVFVPVEDLEAVIAKDQRGVLLPRDEFLKLYRDAQKNAPTKTTAPVGAVISGATYSAKFDGEQLVVEATIKISQLADSWQALPLPLGAMAVESTKLNGQPAKLGRNKTTLFLLNDTRGEHTLTLELSTPLTAVGADKVASVGVLPGIAGTLSVAVPAGKHLQLDGLSVERPAANDQPANYELAVGGKRKAVALQLTDRQRERATDSLLFATTGFGLRVAPGEITWHAVTALQVHGTPLDRLVCKVPKTLEITDVDSNGLEAWELSDDPNDANSTRITLNYRQPFDGSRRIDFRGVMAVPAGESWTVPTLTINQVTSHIGRALVQHAPAVRLRTVEAVGVRTATVSDADLKSIGTSGATDAGQIPLLFDVWREDFSLGFVAQPKEQSVQASISSIFDLTATGLDMITAATMETSFAPLFDLELALPAEWLLTAVTVNGQPLPWQVRTKEDEPGINYIRIPLPQPLRPGQPAKLEVRAHRDPDGWPVESEPVEVSLPELRLPQSSVTEGTYVVKADDDLDVVPGDITGLDPANVPVSGTRLGFVYQDTRFGGVLKVERKPSRVAVRTLTFARLDKQTLHTHFEADLEILGGGLRVLEVALAESAGKDLRFQISNSAARIVEQTSRPGENGELIWTLRLDRHLVGTGTLVVTSVAPRAQANGGRQPLGTTDQTPATPSNEPEGLRPPFASNIPHLRILQADRQNGFIAIEAEGDQRLTITAQDGNKVALAEVDPIDLPAPLAYYPSQRIVASYRYFAGVPKIAVSDERFDRLPIPTAICRVATIHSILSPAGELQHQATFHFTAVGVQSLRVQFGGVRDAGRVASKEKNAAELAPRPSPLAPDLWAALVDGQPVEVRRADSAFLIPLRATENPAAERSLQLFYRTQVPALRGTGELRQPPPELTVLNGAGVSQPMQVLDQQWELHYPPDLLLTDSQGAFVPDATTPLDRTDWLSNLSNSLSLPSWSNVGRMIGAIVCVFIVVAVIWARHRFGWLFGVILPLALLSVGVVILSSYIQPARYAQRHGLGIDVMGGTRQIYRADVGGIVMSDGSAISPTPQMDAPEMPPMAGEPNAPAAATKSELMFEVSRDRGENLADVADEKKADATAGKKGFASNPKDGRELRDQMLGARTDPAKKPTPGKESGFWSPLNSIENSGIPFDDRAAVQFGKSWDDLNRRRMALAQNGESLIMDEVARQSVLGRERGGLLSLTMSLEQQPGAATKKFRYLGTETSESGIGLELNYENRAAGWAGRWLWIAGLAFMAWVLPARCRRFRATWAALGLALPLALAAIAPLGWQNTLDGIFFGTVAAVALWVIRAACESLADAWPRMKSKSFWTGSWIRRTTALCLFAFITANSAIAQEPQAAKPAVAPPVNPNPDIPATPTIIFPYDDPKEPLAAERVYLPHAKFVELWNAAHPDSRKKPLAPTQGEVTEALFVVAPKERQKGDDSAIAELRGRITLFTSKPMWVPIPLKNGVLTETKLDDQPAATQVINVGGESRVAVYLSDVGLHVLDLAAELPIQQAGPTGQLTLQLAPVPAGKLLFVNSGEDLAFRVNGATNSFRVRHGAAANNPREADAKPASEPLSNAASLLQRTVLGQGAKETYYEVAISAGGDVRLAWQPRQAAGAVDAIVQSDSATAVRVEDAGVRISSGWMFKVPRGAINDLSFSLPKELKVRSISGPDVGGWELGENVDGRVLRVFLRRAVNDQTSLAFDLFLETHVVDEPVSIEVPAFAPLQVSRDFGVVGLFAEPQFALKNVATTGMTQINATQFQGVGAGGQGAEFNGAPLSAFRYTARPFEVRFSAQRRAPESTGFAEHALVIERRKVRMSSRLRWELAGALRSSVSVQLPFGWLPVDVDATALQDWHIDPETNVLTVEFTEPRIGAVEVVLQGNVPKEPDDSIAELSVPTPLELSKLVTQAAVWFDSAYQATVSSSSTWKTSDPEHCSEELRNKLSRPAKFVFTSNVVMPEVLGFDLARAVPKFSADAVSLVTVSDTAIDYSLALQWKIAEAAADTFTFTTPDWLSGKLDFQGTGIRQTSFVSAGEGSGRTRWTVTLQDPVAARYFLLATATLPPPAEKREVTAPTIVFERSVEAEEAAAVPAIDGQEASPFAPLNTQRQYVVVINLSSNQLAQIGDVGEPVQRDELPIVVDQRLVDQATAVLRVRGQGPGDGGQEAAAVAPKWSLKSFAAQAGAPASVNLADLTTVLAADGTWRMQCVYTIKNRSRQFLALELQENSQALSVFVADRPSRLVALKKEGKTYQLVALPKTSEADLSFQVKLVLSGRLALGSPRGLTFWSREIEMPTPSVVSLSDDKEYGIPVARTLWAVHVPHDWSAKPLNDPAKNNLAEQADDTAAVAYQSAWLQEANDLMRVIESNSPSSQRMQAQNNLKQIGLAIHSYHEQTHAGQRQSDEGRKLAESLQVFEAKRADLEQRIVIDSDNNFYIAKDQQQAAQAKAAQAQRGKNANYDVFFDQLNGQGGAVQREIISGNNDALFFSNSGIIAKGEDRNGNGVLDPGEDINGDGVLNLGDVGQSAVEAIASNGSSNFGLKFKLNVAPESKPAATKGRTSVSGKLDAGRSFPGNLKGVTEEDRANRRKQAVDQLSELNKLVDKEKFAQQLEQQTANQPAQSQSESIRSRMSQANNGSQALQGGGQLGGFGGGGGFGIGGAGGRAITRSTTGVPSRTAGTQLMDGGMSDNLSLDIRQTQQVADFQSFQGRIDVTEGFSGWTQAGGLSLPIEIQRDGNVLRFSRASGAPRLALTVRPNESDKLGLGIVWAAVWSAIAVWLLRLFARSSTGLPCRQLAVGLIALGLLGMFFLPSLLSEACFLLFAISAVVLSIGVLRTRRQNAAAS